MNLRQKLRFARLPYTIQKDMVVSWLTHARQMGEFEGRMEEKINFQKIDEGELEFYRNERYFPAVEDIYGDNDKDLEALFTSYGV